MNKASYVEKDCKFEFQGKSFKARGAIVTDDFVIGYPAFNSTPVGQLTLYDDYVGANGVLNDWRGNKLGNCKITAKWRTPKSFVSSHQFQIVALVNGVRYTGRSAGHGMIYKGKRIK